MIEVFGYRLEKRYHANPVFQVVMTVVALLVAVLITGILIVASGASLGKAFSGLILGAFGSWKAILETLVKSTPLILTSLAVTLAFRGNIMNIGAEGQLFSGAICSYYVAANFQELPPAIHIALMIFAGFFGGAVCGLIPGLLKGLLKVDETIVTVMLNYIVQFLLSYLLSGVWQAPGEHYYLTSLIPEKVFYPNLIPNTRLHIGFAIAILAAFCVYWLLNKTRLGYEIRSIGFNPIASRFKAINVPQVVITTMLISGGIAGLAGVGEVAGLHHRLRMDISSGYGFTGIIIALLGGLNPFFVILASILMGGLINGSYSMQIFSHVPSALVDAMQAIVLICLLAFQVLANYRIRKVKDVK